MGQPWWRSWDPVWDSRSLHGTVGSLGGEVGCLVRTFWFRGGTVESLGGIVGSLCWTVESLGAAVEDLCRTVGSLG